MKTRLHGLLAGLSMAVILTGPNASALTQSSTFTYQGRLNNSGYPTTGSYDLTFTLFATNTGGGVIAGPVTNLATPVVNGLFTTAIDFGGGVFTGTNYWLEIAVQTNGGGGFATLTPRQPITSVPYATFAGSASNLLGVLPASQLSGAVALASLPTASLVTNGQSSVNFSGTFTGNGGGLTNLNVSMAVNSAAANAPFPGPTRLIFDGDSLTFGANSGGNNYPQWLQQVFFANNRNVTLFTNVAVSGSTLENIQARFTSDVVPFAPTGGTNAWVFIWGGINDLVEQINNDVGVEQLLANYWATARSYGFKVVAFTISDRPDFPNYLVEEGYRQSVNAWIRENPQLYDCLVDVDQLYPASYPGYQTDGIHFSAQSLYVIAKDVYSSLLANPVGRVVPALSGTNLFVFGSGMVSGRLSVGATNAPLVNAGAQSYIDGLVNVTGNAPAFALTRTNNYQWLTFIDGNNCYNVGNFGPNFASYFAVSPGGNIAFGVSSGLSDYSPPFQVIEPTAQFSGTVVATNGFAAAGGIFSGNGSGLTNLVLMTANSSATVTFNAAGNSETQFNVSLSTIASLTINLPTTSIPGEIVRYVSAAAATSVAVNGTVAIGAALTSLAANSSVAWQAVNASGSWVRIQ